MRCLGRWMRSQGRCEAIAQALETQGQSLTIGGHVRACHFAILTICLLSSHDAQREYRGASCSRR